MISIQAGTIGLKMQRDLASATNAVSTAVQRMSTGFKINSAKDDAAGLYVATKMRTKLSGFRIADNNITMGLSYCDTALGDFGEMTNILNRLRDLSVQGANSIYDFDSRNAMGMEAENLIEELDRIIENSKFNGKNIMKKTETPAVTTFSVPLAGGGGG